MVNSHHTELVLIAVRVHLFPSRTQKLSSSAPTILAGRLAGKIGNANTRRQVKTWRFPFEKSPESGKKGLQNRIVHDIIPRVSTIRRTDIGMSPSGKAPDFDSGISSVQIRPSQPYDPLAQQAEQLPFKQWVRGSNPVRVTTPFKKGLTSARKGAIIQKLLERKAL